MSFDSIRMAPAPASLDEVVAQMLELQKALPKRPSFPELESATATISKIDEELTARRSELSRHPKPDDVPEIVFTAFQEMRLDAAEHRAMEQMTDVKKIVELEKRHLKYDKWIRKVHAALSSGAVMDAETDADADLANAVTSEEASTNVDEKDARGSARSVLDATWEFPPSEGSVSSCVGVDGDGLKQMNPKVSAHHRSDSFSRVSQSLSWNKERAKPNGFAEELPSTSNSALSTPIVDEERVRDESHGFLAERNFERAGASKLTESLSMQRQTSLDLRGALPKNIDWVPESIGKMTWLKRLDLSSNKLTTLPDSVGALVNLEHMNVSLNELTMLPETMGQLICLKSLTLDNNKIEELPYNIGQCTSLAELTASFNKLKALPEATGKLIKLHSLDVHFNKLGRLPTTMASMASLVELDASFNEINYVPEGLCQVITLTRLNLSSNFNELQELPANIGNLRKLKVLNVSCNQLRVLPDSLAMLENLQDLDLSGNPLRVPPMHVADQGTKAVLKYMTEYVIDKEKGKVAVHTKSIWSSIFFCCVKPPDMEKDIAA